MSGSAKRTGSAGGDSPTVQRVAESDEHRAAVTGALLGRYVLLTRLGEGGGGEVFVAFDPTLDRKVAVKRLRGGRGEADALLREARILAQLNHPHVVTVHDVGIDDGRAYLAMELVEGADLGAWLAAHGEEVDWRERLRILLAVGGGLQAAHDKGIVHGDVKPANVLLGDDGRILVSDFGVARHQAAPVPDASDSTPDGVLVRAAGTPRYMAPEQHDGVPPDARSDVFAFAVTAWEVLLGAPPFAVDVEAPTTMAGTTAVDPQHRGTPSSGGIRMLAALVEAKRAGPPAAPPDTGGVPAKIVEALRRALAPAPDDRTGSIAELLQRLCLPPPRRARHWVPAAAALGVVGAIAVAMGQPDDPRCQGSDAELATVWDDARRSDLTGTAQRLGAGWPETSATLVVDALDDYADGWAQMHHNNCEATTVRATQSERDMDLRNRCLLRARAELDATVDLLVDADVDLARRAHQMVAQLPTIARCGDVVAIERSSMRPDDPDLDAEVEAIRKELAPALALERAGRYADALAILEPLATRADEVGFAPLIVEMGPVWGYVLERSNRLDEAEQAWKRAIELGVESGPPVMASRAAGMLVAHLTGQQARFDEAEAWASTAIGLARRSGRGTGAEAYALNRRGSANLERGRLDQAVADYEAAVDIWARVYPSGHPEVALGYTSLARGHHKRGDLDQAQQYYERALELLTAEFGPDHPETAVATSNLGTLFEDRGEYQRGLELHRSAEEILRRVVGPDHLEMAMLHTNKGVCEADLGDTEAAERSHREALRIVEKAYGPDHVEVGRTLINIGVLELRRQDYAAAEKTYARSLAILEPELGFEHEHTTATAMNLAIAIASQGRNEEALPLFERVLAARETQYGPDHPAVAAILGNLAHLELEAGRPHDAKAHFERALAIRGARRGEPKDRAFETFGLARATWQTGDKKAGLALAHEALDLWTKAGPAFASLRAEAQTWVDQVGG